MLFDLNIFMLFRIDKRIDELVLFQVTDTRTTRTRKGMIFVLDVTMEDTNVSSAIVVTLGRLVS